MRLTSIEFENFRCFEKEKIDLHPQLNVFVGLNASGKTALLEGVRIGIGKYLQQLGFGGSNNFVPLQRSDQRQVQSQGKVFIAIPISITCRGSLGSSSKEYSWAQRFGSTESDSDEFNSEVGQIYPKIAHSIVVELPILLYLSTQRLWSNDVPEQTRTLAKHEVVGKLAGYSDALTKNSNTSFFEKELEKEQKAVQQSKELGYDYDSSRLHLIRSLAAKVIEDCEIFYFDYEMESLAVMFKDGRRLAINDLSDGQKSLLLISTGIAFQCATLNPHMGLDAYKSHGVVLIDEVELHLHPEWQRQILPILTREFPNIQFICTTHSPQVISSLDRECVQVIENFHVHPLERFVKGRDSNAILGEVFGIEKRPREYSDQLQHFYTLLEAHEFEKAKETLERLEEVWGSMDAEIVRGWLFWADGQEVVIDDSAEVA